LDQLGFDLAGIQDHPYQSRFLDTWSLMAMIAARTERLRVFPDVANLPLRPPAMLAKAAATIDLLSDGRFELGLGAGYFWEGIAAMGGPRRTPGEAFTSVEEAIVILHAMWSGERSVSFDGEIYQLKGVHPGPSPAHPIEIWLGAYGPRMIDLIGRKADGWIPSFGRIGFSKMQEGQRRIDEAAERAGRDPSSIRRLLNIGGQIKDQPGEETFQGPVDQWVEDLTRMVLEYGFDTFILSGDDLDQATIFAEEVIPRVRERVDDHRAGASEQ
jgi:alkanesulfonate monooxygenase SsuD/methylene tetrahydromethanopterin reductase-like flavin-dependent oxidoreductase (luciferase family)